MLQIAPTAPPEPSGASFEAPSGRLRTRSAVFRPKSSIANVPILSRDLTLRRPLRAPYPQPRPHPEAPFARAKGLEGCSRSRLRRRLNPLERPSRPLRGASGRGRWVFGARSSIADVPILRRDLTLSRPLRDPYPQPRPHPEAPFARAKGLEGCSRSRPTAPPEPSGASFEAPSGRLRTRSAVFRPKSSIVNVPILSRDLTLRRPLRAPYPQPRPHPEAPFALAKGLEGSRSRLRRRLNPLERPSRPLRGASGRGRWVFGARSSIVNVPILSRDLIPRRPLRDPYPQPRPHPEAPFAIAKGLEGCSRSRPTAPPEPSGTSFEAPSGRLRTRSVGVPAGC